MSRAPACAGETTVAESCAALALARVEGLGPVAIRRTIDRHGTARAALRAFRDGELPPGRHGRSGTTADPALLERLRSLEPASSEEVEGWSARGIRLVSYSAAGYPERLGDLHDPPTVLFLQGVLELPARKAVTIIGSRAATEYGRRMARDLAAGFVRHGWTVVSGLARGIDAEAHRATLDAGGRTVGVLGGGLEHGRGPLRRTLRAHGLLASEMEPPVAPDRWAFPRRNRILAALGEAVVVVQAGRRSGTSITVGYALDLGREVLAVPGPVGPEASVGVHRLLRTGAGIATSAEDVLEALGQEIDVPTILAAGGGPARAALPGPREASLAILRRVADGPAGGEELAAASGLPLERALALVSRLEVAGWLDSVAGGRYSSSSAQQPPDGGGAGSRDSRPGPAGSTGTEAPIFA